MQKRFSKLQAQQKLDLPRRLVDRRHGGKPEAVPCLP